MEGKPGWIIHTADPEDVYFRSPRVRYVGIDPKTGKNRTPEQADALLNKGIDPYVLDRKRREEEEKTRRVIKEEVENHLIEKLKASK